jgi:hypothetical protein
MAYSTEDEVRALLGNLRQQIAQATILSAIDSADAQINRVTFKTWTVGDSDYNAIKKASRYYAAAECMININGTEPTQQRLWDEATLILQNITKFDTSNVTGDYVSMSQPATYPSNLQGSIWTSSRFPMLRKSNRDNEQIDNDFYWVNGNP